MMAGPRTFDLRAGLITGLVSLLVLAAAAEMPQTAADEPAIVVERDRDEGVTMVTVPAPHGLLDWNDVWRGLAQVSRLDSEPVTQGFEWELIDLTKPRHRLALRALSAAVPDVSVRTLGHAESDEFAVRIRVEKDDAQKKVRKFKSLIRERFGHRGNYGLQLDEQWHRQPLHRPLVVLVHGYSSGPDSLGGVRTALTERGWPCSLFVYPNDGPLDESGEKLSEALKQFQVEHPGRKVVIVAHSMGGLVARAAIENPELDPGNVERLIMICTPNHGTQWAELPGGLECWDFLQTSLKAESFDNFRATLGDGLNEARSDLQPGSRFLRKLNGRPRNSRVRYSLILGTASPLTSAQVADLRERVIDCMTGSRSGRVFRPRVEEFFMNLDELQAGKGDGVVSLARGRLAGVDNTILLPISHAAITGDAVDSVPEELQEAILAQLTDAH